jgi:hypothetical protein
MTTATERSYSSKFGDYLTAAEVSEREALLAAELADDSILYVGSGKNQKIYHLIAGKAKSVKQPLAVCGQWVSNKNKTTTEATDRKICAKCSKGHKTSFSTFNQPRTCAECGKRYADAASRDTGAEVCADCYEAAGYVNAHDDGYHNDAAEAECPSCQAEARGRSASDAVREYETLPS